MIDKLDMLCHRFDELGEQMADLEVISDISALQEIGREQSSLEPTVILYRKYRKSLDGIAEAEAMIEEDADPDLIELAREEAKELRTAADKQLAQLRDLLAPKDPNDEKNVFVEVRAGTGGGEAALFAADLFRMYSRYAERKRWSVEIINSNETGIGGFKEIVFQIRGRGAYSHLKYESGVHRVQRVPSTESSGRIHTSTATVAVLPEVADVEININPEDLKIDTYCSSGAGGQNVNKVASAVRITHLPTGIVVACQDERSQLKNKTKAMAVLRARIYDIEQSKQAEAVDSSRRSQVGTGERSEKIRTYNFPQDRLTDHRIGMTVHQLPSILDGSIDELIQALADHDRHEREAA